MPAIDGQSIVVIMFLLSSSFRFCVRVCEFPISSSWDRKSACLCPGVLVSVLVRFFVCCFARILECWLCIGVLVLLCFLLSLRASWPRPDQTRASTTFTTHPTSRYAVFLSVRGFRGWWSRLLVLAVVAVGYNLSVSNLSSYSSVSSLTVILSTFTLPYSTVSSPPPSVQFIEAAINDVSRAESCLLMLFWCYLLWSGS